MNLKQLAEKLKLSQTTVSRALNGYPEVSETTRARVVAMARKHNYHPNSHAAQLATGRARAIGHVVPISAHNMIDTHFADFIAGAGETYAESAYDCILSVVDADGEAEVYRRLATTRRVDGVVVHGPRLDDRRIDLLESIGLPFVVHGRTMENIDSYSWLDVNNRRAFRRATEHLVDLGHTRIGLINGQDVMTFAARRRAGFEEGLAGRGLAADPALYASGEMTEPNGHAAAMRFLASREPPTALMASSIMLAVGALRAVQESGLAVGRDVSIITYDDCLSAVPNDGGEPMFTAVRSSMRLAGRRVAQMLIDLVDAPSSGPLHELWDAELVIGRSTGPAPHRQAAA